MLVVVIAAMTLTALSRASAKVAVASSYSAETSSSRQGCSGAPPLRDSALSVATFLVRCGQRLRICLGKRCVVATRWDSGPYVEGRELDLNVGVVRALGFPSATQWGVRTVTWSPAARRHATRKHDRSARRHRHPPDRLHRHRPGRLHRHPQGRLHHDLLGSRLRKARRAKVDDGGPLVVFEPLPRSLLGALLDERHGQRFPLTEL